MKKNAPTSPPFASGAKQIQVIELINMLQEYNPDLLLSFSGEGESFSTIEGIYLGDVYIRHSFETKPGLHLSFAF